MERYVGMRLLALYAVLKGMSAAGKWRKPALVLYFYNRPLTISLVQNAMVLVEGYLGKVERVFKPKILYPYPDTLEIWIVVLVMKVNVGSDPATVAGKNQQPKG